MNDSEFEKRLSDWEQQYHSLFYDNTNAVFVLNKAGQFTRVNPGMLSMTKYDEKKLLSMSILDLVEKKSKQEAAGVLNAAMGGVTKTFESQIRCENGEGLFFHVTLIPKRHDQMVNGVIGIAQNITERRMAEREMTRLANEDGKTRLPNERMAREQIERAVGKMNQGDQWKVAVLLVDLDRFKHVNDTLGHLYGDWALKTIGERIKMALEKEQFLGKMEGDKFLILLPTIVEGDVAIEVGKRIQEQIKKPLFIDGYEFSVTACIGIALYPDNGNGTDALLKAADAALYRAKSSGSDTYKLYADDMKRKLYEWFYMENALRKAIQRGEFELYFQPQFHLETATLSGEEVLVRWRHPQLGLLSPSAFISIAEETGLILPLGEWVLREACKQKRIFLDKGFPAVPISINLSLRQFLQQNIVEVIESILEETGLSSSMLEIEITESVTIDLERTLHVLSRLKEIGIRISLDDFGTGYSSLQYLSQLPIHKLKIDQSFVRSLENGNNSKAIISMIINLGHLLKLTVIAEGVEHEEQLAFLREQGCDTGQGYYYSKPLTTSEYIAFLKSIGNQ
ncbi:sensor domain-containing protein [Halalkalibacterium ligniniphilum]|uniref:sensor domain-containing protein n=1 Tax=Halalkalibacterium ligniniphilum TaxID=1134413 RepID=UPI000347F71C|nr:EAL domain-containing protein [Halalkalibacterium ligniniphilum]